MRYRVGVEAGLSRARGYVAAQEALGRMGLVYAEHLKNERLPRVASQRELYEFGHDKKIPRIHCGKAWRVLAKQSFDANEASLWPQDFEPLGGKLVYHKGMDTDFSDGNGGYKSGFKTIASRRRAFEGNAEELDFTSLLSYLDALRQRTHAVPSEQFEGVIKENIRTGQTSISPAMVALGVWCKFAEEGLPYTRRPITQPEDRY